MLIGMNDIKRLPRRFLVIAVILAVISVAACTLLLFSHGENQSLQRRIDSMVLTAIANSRDGFSDYMSTSSAGSYLLGTNSFYMFLNVYPESSYYDSYSANILHTTYAKLLSREDFDPGQLEVLVDALDILSENPFDAPGYTGLQIFINYSLYY